MADQGLTQTLGEKMAEVMKRYGVTEVKRATVHPHEHGEPTTEHKIAGAAVKELIEPGELERVSRHFHETVEALSPIFGYGYGGEPVPWDATPARTRALTVAVIRALIEDGTFKL